MVGILLRNGSKKIFYHDIPFEARANGTPHLQHHPCKEPEETTNAVFALVVGRNSNVHIPHRRISVTESNGGNIPKSSFLNRLHTNEQTHTLTTQHSQHHNNRKQHT